MTSLNPKKEICDNSENLENSLISPDGYSKKDFNPPLRLAVMASGNGSNFEAIVNAIINKKLKASVIALIVNNPNCKAKERAERLNIKCIVHDHRDYPKRTDFDKVLVDTLKFIKVEGIVMAGWMRIVTSTLINAFPGRIINIHPSILPSFKGTDAISQALNSKVCITGCTVHFVSESVDSGPIIYQAALPIYKEDDKKSLTIRLQELEHDILPKAISIAGEIWRE